MCFVQNFNQNKLSSLWFDFFLLVKGYDYRIIIFLSTVTKSNFQETILYHRLKNMLSLQNVIIIVLYVKHF